MSKVIWKHGTTVQGEPVSVITGREDDGTYLTEVSYVEDDEALSKQSTSWWRALKTHREGVRIVRMTQAKHGK